MNIDRNTYRLTDGGRYGTVALGLGIGGLVLSAVGYLVDPAQFFHSYLTAFVFWLTIGLGGIFFTMLHHLVGARWSVVLRRLAEAIGANTPWMIIFFIPLLAGMHELYHWTHAEAVASDQLLQAKAPYLNVGFFIVRAVFYFAVWLLLAYGLYRLSLKQDSGHTEEIRKKMVRLSAPGMIAFAVTITFASFDWLMSLDAHWYSTIFGVYIFSGALVGILSFMTITAVYLRKKNILAETITVEHYHDLGRLTFAFTVFWAYMAFSQYFLIWYANIPEETVWFLHRWEGGWKTLSLVLVLGHFVIPFFILITRGAKRKPGFLKIIVIWMFLMHLVDLYWVVMPSLHHHGVHLSWIDPVTVIGIGGIFCWLFWRRLLSQPLVPVGDPGLDESINISHG